MLEVSTQYQWKDVGSEKSVHTLLNLINHAGGQEAARGRENIHQ